MRVHRTRARTIGSAHRGAAHWQGSPATGSRCSRAGRAGDKHIYEPCEVITSSCESHQVLQVPSHPNQRACCVVLLAIGGLRRRGRSCRQEGQCMCRTWIEMSPRISSIVPSFSIEVPRSNRQSGYAHQPNFGGSLCNLACIDISKKRDVEASVVTEVAPEKCIRPLRCGREPIQNSSDSLGRFRGSQQVFGVGCPARQHRGQPSNTSTRWVLRPTFCVVPHPVVGTLHI